MNIVYISDFDFKSSGYFNISTKLCSGLVEKGHDVKVLGINYRGDEHNFPFSIIPVRTLKEIYAMMQNLVQIWPFNAIIVALDIPLQEQILNVLGVRPKEVKYIGIMPIESDPLIMDWAMVLMQMDKALIISEFGTKEAIKAGVQAEHIPVGMDIESWKVPTEEERNALRKTFGIEDDCFVVLTVADNQERKNLSAAFEIFSDFHKDEPNSKYVLVTREHSPVGWKLKTMASDFGFLNSLMLFERGIGFLELWSLYAMTDAFLLTSKAEGLGMPLLEAMAMKIPCVGTDCTGIKELLSDGRGFLVDWDYSYIDPFGNENRYLINKEQATNILHYIKDKKPVMNSSREYIEKKEWKNAVEILNNALMEE